MTDTAWEGYDVKNTQYHLPLMKRRVGLLKGQFGEVIWI